MRSDRKQTIIFVIILLVMSLGIGYAFLTTTLNINGTSDIDSAVWDVHWENAELYAFNLEDGQLIHEATIDGNGTSVSFHIHFKKPFDSYYFSIDAVNDGTLDAVIDNISLKINGSESTELPFFLEQSFIYKDGTDSVEKNQLLLAGDTKSYVYGIRYKGDYELDPSDLPEDDLILSISIDVDYRQIQNVNEAYMYSIFDYDTPINTPFSGNVVGQRISSSTAVYSSFVTQESNDVFLKYNIDNNKNITGYSVGFVYNGNTYYLKALGATYNSSLDGYNNDSIYYEENVNVLKNAFGEGNCYLNEYEFGTEYSCKIGKYEAKTFKNGSVSAYLNSRFIKVVENGYSYKEIAMTF